ncbi:6-pyruvoyltetrahydropterin/6-carboxytetrahydropterin synthase [Ruminiclostridium sufflavum DSM 19573]|uniref:6-carboxy-5,6,7,8-tetrahydropterin synthase n=1 Tax=Ruminiclostridium sufflavum DSM 19573 TaxID=1121337 RepID=A0A318XKI5_9FIRM|nr:6-carboxytetrahydropterin synthase [Ruminiclostridium sufflavum]PYG85026.1 6-pyruvoyltetrahydropterin/6-carboxytetrahydropterin synthase [Ruminiclostridium sufflavum DSM 19573]
MSIKRHRQYKFKFYLNASHAIFINGALGSRHTHTWEISIHLLKILDEFIKFTSFESHIEALLEEYQDKFINEVEPFNIINPTLENICTYFKDRIRELVNCEGWILLLIEISETPTRSYVINLLTEESDTSLDNIDSQKMQYENYMRHCKLTANDIADNIIDNLLSDK